MKVFFLLVQCVFFLGVHAQDVTEDKIELIPVLKIMDYAFKNSQVVMMNEAHYSQKRNIRTRIIGQLVLPKAHSHGVRHLAMEALTYSFAEKANLTRILPVGNPDSGYLHQPEMRELMRLALDLGWKLMAYKENGDLAPKVKSSLERDNWREKKQAENLKAILDAIGEKEKLLVWCGNSHLEKEPGLTPDGELLPMGYQFWKLTGIEPFTIDQIITVDFSGKNKRFQKWKSYEAKLKNNFHGTLGFINSTKSAKIISIHNTLE